MPTTFSLWMALKEICCYTYKSVLKLPFNTEKAVPLSPHFTAEWCQDVLVARALITFQHLRGPLRLNCKKKKKSNNFLFQPWSLGWKSGGPLLDWSACSPGPHFFWKMCAASLWSTKRYIKTGHAEAGNQARLGNFSLSKFFAISVLICQTFQ